MLRRFFLSHTLAAVASLPRPSRRETVTLYAVRSDADNVIWSFSEDAALRAAALLNDFPRDSKATVEKHVFDVGEGLPVTG